MSSWKGSQSPDPSAQRAPPFQDESMFVFADTAYTLGTPFSLLNSSSPSNSVTDTQATAGSLTSDRGFSFGPDVTLFPSPFTPFEEYQAPFQLSSPPPSNTMPTNNHRSLLSLHFEEQTQSYAHSHRNTITTSPVINQPSIPNVPPSPMLHSTGPSLNTNVQDQYFPLKFENRGFQPLSPVPEATSPASERPIDQGQVQSKPMGTPSINLPQTRWVSRSDSARHHPYRLSNSLGSGDSIHSPGTPSVNKQFSSQQQKAARSIREYMEIHPNTVIPDSLITAEFAEVQDGREWCLVGDCGVNRAKQKLNPDYDAQKDTTRKRLDHLYAHIKDKHFHCRPFRCSHFVCFQAFSREHDIRLHERTHAVTLSCYVCGKRHTREDNLKRHTQQRHLPLPQTSRGTSIDSFPS